MKRILALCAGVLAIVGCGSSKATVSDFRSGVPSSASVSLSVPTSSTAVQTSPTQPMLQTGTTQQALQGDPASLYQLTRAVTVGVNLGTVTVLGLIRAITDQTPTSFDGNTAVWGPYTASHSPNTWRLTLMKSGDHTYSYALEGKDKNAPDSSYLVVLSGTHTPALDASGRPERDFGSGTFLIDWDKAQQLPEHDDNVGTAAFTYARPSLQDTAHIDVAFRGTLRLFTPGTTDADYHWDETPGQGGNFTFTTQTNVDRDANNTLEDLAIKSRWQAGGAGRSDVKATGGDLPSPATVNECWNASFQSTYLNESFDASAGYGTEATDCVFTSADYAGG